MKQLPIPLLLNVTSLPLLLDATSPFRCNSPNLYCPAAADRPPVVWVQLDPHGESLACTRLLQPDWMWAAQLEQSKDTATQSAALAGLAALSPTTYTVVSALEHCLQDDQVYPRYV